jgi:hypothetical protein
MPPRAISPSSRTLPAHSSRSAADSASTLLQQEPHLQQPSRCPQGRERRRWKGISTTGNLALDRELLEAADIIPFEEVHVWNVTR